MTTNVYIDGFNLYYGTVKNTPYRWLNLAELCHLLLPGDHIKRIKYFTAKVKALPRDPGQPGRQSVYLRALTTIANLEIFYGHFLSNQVMMPLANGSGFVSVVKTEEKGSDVALATHLLHDAHKDEYDIAVIVSNDSDLIPPIRVVRQDFGKQVGLICPQKRICEALANEVHFRKQIRDGVLKASQFPDKMTDSVGSFQKPASW